jgi:acyl-CoA thioesterase I
MEPMRNTRNGNASRGYAPGRAPGSAPGSSWAQVVALLAIFNVLLGFSAAPSVAAGKSKPLNIVAFGDSLFSGYGLRRNQAFPAQLQKALEQRGHDVTITNAGVAGDTTAAGLARLAWSVPKNTDAVILEFGANDALRGIDPKITRTNLEEMLAAFKARNVPVLLVGMRSPANWGDGYADNFDAIFPDLASEHSLILYPFLLDGVVLDAKLNQDDGMHPNRKGVAEIVKRITPAVEELIERAAARRTSASKS